MNSSGRGYLAFYFVKEVVVLKKGKEITVFLALTLILSGCGGEKEKSRSEVKAAAAVSVQSTRETVKYTETINTEILTEAAVTEILCRRN